MAIITIRNLSIGFRGPLLLDDVSCRIDAGERIGLLGRNGAGKTTLMRILCGELETDGGQVDFAAGVRVARLPQDVPRDKTGTIADMVAEGLSGDSQYTDEPWRASQAVERLLSMMLLDGSAEFSTLSSGMKRRVLLAQTLVSQPDVLLLDEPTNHLDLGAIQWLEDFLLAWSGTLIFVTHDRVFLRRLATRILEIEAGRLFDWTCDYATFLQRKGELLAATEKQHALFDKKLSEEERWIRQGIKARRTRNEGRVRALETMREQFRQRRKAVGQVRLRIDEGDRSGTLVSGLENVCFSHDRVPILRDFSVSIMRGDKIGIIGPNGAGKTTLLQIMLGQLTPQSGRVRMGTNLNIAYFDQLREQLAENESVQHNVSDGYDNVVIEGRPQHVIGYLQGFLFSAERSRTAVKYLSGGERNRVLLARLFAKPANTIVLDEPTNDLDTETLELLEQRLVEFAGTVLLVSHDREFLNNVVTSTIVFEAGQVNEYAGGYDDWRRQRAAQRSEESTLDAAKFAKVNRDESTSGSGRVVSLQDRRLSYKEQRELNALPGRIEQLETAIAALHRKMASGDFYQQSRESIALEKSKLDELELDLRTAYARWEALE